MGCSASTPVRDAVLQKETGQPEGPQIVPQVYEGAIEHDGRVFSLVQCVVRCLKQKTLLLDELLIHEPDGAGTCPNSSQECQELRRLLPSGSSIELMWEPASKRVWQKVSTAGAAGWEGTYSASGGLLQLHHQGSGFCWELQPRMPFLHHFTVGGTQRARPLLLRFVARMQDVCKRGQQMRLHVSLGGSEECIVGGKSFKEPAVPGSIATSATYLLILTPEVWESKQVQEDVLEAERLGKTILLLYRTGEEVHKPKHPSPFSPISELLAIEGVNIGSLIQCAPPPLARLFDFMEAVPYRAHPALEDALVRHVISLAGFGSCLVVSTPPDPALVVEEYQRPAVTSSAVQELLAGDLLYYEGIALKPQERDGETPKLRGHYQATLQLAGGQSVSGESEVTLLLDVTYSPKLTASMPHYQTVMRLAWQPSSSCVKQTSAPLGMSRLWAEWEGRLSSSSATIEAQEGTDTVILRPLPFLWHFYATGAGEATAMGNVLAAALQQSAAPARRSRVFLPFGLPSAERRNALAKSACFILILSPHVWQDEACMADLAEAVQQSKQIFLVQDPDPRMPTHTSPRGSLDSAPPQFKFLFDCCDVFGMHRRWFEQQAFAHSVLRAAGFHGSLPFRYEQDLFAEMLEQKKSDVQELATLKAGLWWYYEGVAERRGKLWGYYQVDAKFKPAQDLIEFIVQFVSRSPESIPGYTAVFVLNWDQCSGAVAIREPKPRWQGHLEGAVGGTFHLRNNYGDILTFMALPFVWHFFLSHIQRESSDLCGSLVACMQSLSPIGKTARIWYDQQAAAVINRDAMELGVRKSNNFVLMMTPSIFKSSYVRFELQAAMEGQKRILLVYDPTPHLKSSVDLVALSKEAPAELHAAFHAHLQEKISDVGLPQADAVVLPFPGGGTRSEQLAFARAIMARGGVATKEA